MSGGGLWEFYRSSLAGAIFTDLTHAFYPGQPHFLAFPDEERHKVLDYPNGDAFQVHHYGFVGQWGTHVDPPVHFIEGGRTLDNIPVSQMLLPLVVIDITAKVASSPDATPGLDDIDAWETRNGRIPAGAFAAIRTDWSKRWPDADRMFNRSVDGVSHTPGWSREALHCLLEERGVTAVGHEQIDTDPGISTSAGNYGLERFVLSLDRWQIELMCNLDKVPEVGALIMTSWPKAKDGSGFPARAVAIHR